MNDSLAKGARNEKVASPPRDIIDEVAQASVVEALQDGSLTGDVAPLARIDTHMSRVFLGPAQVYKLKRARRHPFVDFSVPSHRMAACREELAVNRAFAPDLYEAVRAVTRRNDGELAFDGPGETVDWVVVMRRLDPGAIFDEMADAGQLPVDLIGALADDVARFHATLAPQLDAGRPRDYARIIDGLAATEMAGAGAMGLEHQSTELFSRLRTELVRLSPVIEARRQAGWVRRGHGDLHLRNICLFQGKATPFDALEFDPALATTDVLYDLGFLLMDLRARGLGAHANTAMNRYWDATGQPETALALLPLFTALRAAVRMAVAVEAGVIAEADDYRKLALQLVDPLRPRLVAVGGLSGTGKSVLARALSPRLPGVCGARLLRSDVVRKQLAGIALAERLDANAYHQDCRAEIYDLLAERAREALVAGASVVADATFREGQARQAIEHAADGYPFTGLWLRAPAAVRAKRILNRVGDASDITADLAARQSEPADLDSSWTVVGSGYPPADVAAVALRRIEQQA